MLPLLIAYQNYMKMATKGVKAVKVILFIIVLILSIVSLAGSVGAKTTPKGKIVLTLCIILFLMTLCLPALSMLESNTKVIISLLIYFTIALVTTILAHKNSKEINNKASNNTKRSTTGIVVVVGIYLLAGIYLLYLTHDYGVKNWAKQGYFI